MADLVSLLSVTEIRVAYGYQKLLEGLTLSVAPGEKVGLVGRNGCGKTTLLKILAGLQEADSGEISTRRGLRVGYLPQEFELQAELNVLQNIELGAADLLSWISRYESGQGSDSNGTDLLPLIEQADGWNLQNRIQATATALSTPELEQSIVNLSGGEKRRVALCRALVGQPDLLLLDEPTNHLDSESIGWLEEFLRAFKGAVIFVTHDRYFLDVIATRIVEIADGKAFSHPGNYTAYLESKAIRQQIAEQSERRRQRYLRVELEWVRAGVRAQRSKAKHRLDTYYATEGLEAPPEERDMDMLIPPAPELGNVVINLENVGAKVDRINGNPWLFRNLNLVLKPGECTGVIGRNGVGKTTLLRLCLGDRQADEGTVVIGKKVIFNYIDQARMQLDHTKTVMEEISEGNESVLFGSSRIGTRAYLRRFLFADERVKERVDRLSGGERARLMLAKVLRRGGNVVVLDEPTNDLDLPSLRILEQALADFDGSVLVVSHDRYFLDRICDQIVCFEETGVMVHRGNYSYYLEKRAERNSFNNIPSSYKNPPRAGLVQNNQDPEPLNARPKRLSYKEQREWESMEDQILIAEQVVAEIEEQLNDPSFFITRAKEAPGLIAQLEPAKQEVTRLYARWEELSARVSG